MPSLALLAATPRTVSVSLDADRFAYMLDAARTWRLSDADGRLIAEGETETVVFTLCGLTPQSHYRLDVDGERLDFATRPESLLIDITDCGASPDGDDNAPAIQSAIDRLPPMGTVRIPAGTFHSSPIFLKSDMTLLLEEGAVLSAVADRSRYPILPARHTDGRVLGTWEGVAEPCFASLVTALDCRNLILTGVGRIDGGGDRGDWWTWPKETRQNARRPRTIFLSHGEAIILSGITVCNSPSWTIHPVFCRHLIAAGLTIENDPLSPNTDGFNPECSREIVLSGLHFSVGDDCIAIKAGKRDPKGGLDQPCEEIMVENCRMERGHGGVVIGSEMSGGVRNVTVRRCAMRDTDRGLRIKTRRGRGGVVEKIRLEDCVMTGVAVPLVVNSFYFCDSDGRSDYVQSRLPLPVTQATPVVRDIAVRNLVAENVGVAAAAFYGLPEAPITGITIDGYRVGFDPDAVADVPDMACGFTPLRHGRIIAENARIDRSAALEFSPAPQSIAV
ncbi:glycoside hydrolase family 28 protein [Rhizobium sp. SSA_523]|uniref:polygalacturonase PglA n=1 Tax=Rhizobium sp. SSA_523 TaxID=2952477 RepID=UPI0020918D08|nr:glycoside hydrolase family 28 protein [Rhizobium sp. SSA_523]MCO5731434.1 glycoside hydrolase family 28 protein [Rhizobium sp. SSA_523]WKC22044.1 glycoside hydrolase family 28 protein [Rhizobium sp. SSA_523]